VYLVITGFPASVRRRRESSFLIGQLQYSLALIGGKIKVKVSSEIYSKMQRI